MLVFSESANSLFMLCIMIFGDRPLTVNTIASALGRSLVLDYSTLHDSLNLSQYTNEGKSMLNRFVAENE